MPDVLKIIRKPATVTITSSGTACTVTETAHRRKVGDLINISGGVGDSANYNKTHATITAVTANTWDYTADATPAESPSTGTITAGGDYDDWSAWLADDLGGTSADHVTDEERCIGEMYNDWSGTDGLVDYIVVSGQTCSESYNMIIRAADGHSHDGTPESGARWTTTNAAGQHLIRFSQYVGGGAGNTYIVIGGKGRGIEFQNQRTTSFTCYMQGQDQFIIDSCLFDYESQDGSICISAAWLGDETGYLILNNLFIVDAWDASTSAVVYVAGASTSVGSYNEGNFFHNTIVGPATDCDYGFEVRVTHNQYVRVHNNVVHTNASVEDYEEDTAFLSDGNNASGDATAPGTNSHTNITDADEFVSPSTNDWRPKSTGNLAGGAGDISSYDCWTMYNAQSDQTIDWTNTPYDILGNTRTGGHGNHDIGALIAEAAAAAGLSFVMLI